MSILDNVLVYDTEVTIYKHQNLAAQDGAVNTKNKEGSAFCLPQKLVMSGFRWVGNDEPLTYDLNCKDETQDSFNDSTLIVGFNIKFDLHWARRIGVDISKVVVWDCQLAEFILDSQRNKYPSMNKTCEKYGFDKKLDVVSQDYWEKGLDTDVVPRDILREYLYMDLELTEKIFKQQLYAFKEIEL